MTQNWNTALYEGEHGFVWQLGESLLQWLSPQPGEFILDLGCGTGHLTDKIASKENVAAIAQAVADTLETMDYPQLGCPWYFPSIGEYATRLERQGFEVIQATLSDRPTPLAGEETDLANWLRMFATGWLSPLSDGEKTQVVETLEEKLRNKLYHDNCWIADYRRIRLLAYKL